ncbi:unnamed protein product [Clavelina lepadiformis]|uniref:Carboxylesterase type B domain-containing protein n=1 Tax=Clavelina lepadiformis TaxID=159417 RepID=A0ABP0H153_CLALP
MPESKPDIILQKLKCLPAESLSKAGIIGFPYMNFTICIDGKFLPDWPEKLMQNDPSSSIPTINGCNNTEMHGELHIFMSPPKFYEGYSEEEAIELCKMVISTCSGQEIKDIDKAVETVKSAYMKDLAKNDRLRWSRFTCDFQHDFYFTLHTLAQV